MTTRARQQTPPAENPSSSPAPPEALPEIKRTGAASVRLFPPHGTRALSWLTFCQVVTQLAEQIPTEVATVMIKDGLLMVTWEE